MFTGIVTAIGTVRDLPKGSRLVLEVPFATGEVAVGASISVSGACLTVAAKGEATLEFDLSPETRARTTLGSLTQGDRVNLERALKLGDELGGHFVMGHVDAVAEVLKVEALEGGANATLALPDAIAGLVAEKGSIAVDGVSLTVNAVGRGSFAVMLIPHTLYTTALKGLKPGDKVNLEADVMARHAKRAKDYLKGR